MSTRRLAESVEGLNSSLAAGNLWPKKGWSIAAVKGLMHFFQDILNSDVLCNFYLTNHKHEKLHSKS